MNNVETVGLEFAASGFFGISWVTMLWIVLTSLTFTLSIIHGFIWLRQRREVASGMFALLAIFTSAMSLFDLAMMQSKTPETYVLLLRWFHVPIWLSIVAIVGFLRFYLMAGRRWLGLLAIITRAISLLINFLSPVNLNYKEITSLKWIPFLGDQVAVPVGVPNPAMALGQFSLLMLLVYIIDASIISARMGHRRRAVTSGVGMAFFVGLASTHGALVFWGVIEAPVITSFFFIGIVGFMAYELSRDVLNAAQYSRDLNRERILIEAIFDGLPGMIYMYSAEGRLLRWNKRVEDESGYSPEELSRMTITDWIDPEDQGTMLAEWNNAMSNRMGRLEMNLVLKGGCKVPYLLTGIRVNIDGQPHLVGMGLNMSRQKEMENELQRQQRELTHMNRIASLGILVASIAHELNQPLAAVKGNTQAAMRYLTAGDLDLKQLGEIIADIDSANTRASEVVRGLRALMRNEPPHMGPVDVNRIVDSVVMLVKGECKMRMIEIDTSLTDNLPAVHGDRIQLQQVLLNLLLNSIEALSEFSVSPRQISIKTDSSENARVRLAVSDNGPGIPVTHLEEVFRPFYTLKKKGMGMGLPICRSILDVHNGSIRASCPSGGGTLMQVELPLRKS